MKRMLVVVDGTVQASLALDQALEIARAFSGCDLLLLAVPALPPPWQVRRPERGAGASASERVMARALARAQDAGVPARGRVVAGETAEVAARVAREERCDHIFLPEQGPAPVARALFACTGLSTSTAASRILSLATVPVTVVAHEGRAEL